MRIKTNSARETISLGKKISRCLSGKEIILFEGELGGGKTTFIKGLLSGLGYKGKVLSPSFTLERQYKIKKNIVHHIDLYRLDLNKDLLDMGFDEFLNQPGHITLIEWGEKIEDQLTDYIKVIFNYSGENSRLITISDNKKNKL